MKKVLQVSPWVILSLIYVPSLGLIMLSHIFYVENIDRATWSMIGSMWTLSCFSAWLWVVSVAVSKKITSLNVMSLNLLRSGFLLPAFFVTLPILGNLLAFILPINSLFPFLTFDFFNKLYILFLFSLIYPVYFIAKYLRTIELKTNAAFNEYSLTVLSFIVPPLGIFGVQRRVKNLSTAGQPL